MMQSCNDFRWDLKVGQLFEDELANILERKTIEVKTDFMASQTGNVFVEFFCRNKPSGLATTKADYWAFILGEKTVVLLPTDELKKLARQVYREKGKVRGGDGNFSLGVLIPIERLVTQCRQ